MKERITKLVKEYKSLPDNRADERAEKFKELVDKYGYENVALASGYKMSTLHGIISGYVENVSETKIRQTLYVFGKIESELK